MDKEKKERIIMFIHKWLLHIEAMFIIGLMLTGFWILYNDNLIKQEISLNCGYAEEDYECLCRKSDVIAMKNKARQTGVDMPNYTDLLSNINLTEPPEDA